MENKELKSKVMDLLNQIVILTKGVPEPQQVENYNYQYEFVTEDKYEKLKSEAECDVDGKPLKKPDDDAIYLYTVGQYCERVVKGAVDRAVHNENQYYQSNC